MSRIVTSIADLREIAKKQIPRVLFEYVDRGSYDEITLHRNRRDLDGIKLKQRVGMDVSNQSLKTSVVGQQIAMPLVIAPTGLTGLFRKDGEILGARAALSCGVPFCLSTMSICSVEELKESVNGPFWFQLYLMKDRGLTEALISRAQAVAAPVLVLTLDLAVIGLRRQEVKEGLAIPPKITISNILDILSKPAWASSVLLGGKRTFGNITDYVRDTKGIGSLAQWISSQCDPSVTWSDVTWVKSRWPGKLVLKGILDPEDARRACDLGADAIVVSNHGGRQLDGAPSSISVLKQIAEAVGGRCEVLFDGGIQSGQDIFKALALGARACLIGKAYVYSLAAMGQSGVQLAINLIRKELLTTMALAGICDVAQIDDSTLFDYP